MTGRITAHDAASLTLSDAANHRIRIRCDDIQIHKESPILLAPHNSLQPLKPKELRDLFQTLQSGAT